MAVARLRTVGAARRCDSTAGAFARIGFALARLRARHPVENLGKHTSVFGGASVSPFRRRGSARGGAGTNVACAAATHVLESAVSVRRLRIVWDAVCGGDIGNSTATSGMAKV